MKRKRFNHQVETLCQIFCGWRLVNSHEALTKLGSGEIRIDLLKKQAFFNEQLLNEFNIAEEMYTWFYKDLSQHNIDIRFIKEASFTATLCIKALQGKRQSKEIWTTQIKEYISCTISCKCVLFTDEAEYSHSLKDIDEWPNGWWNEKALIDGKQKYKIMFNSVKQIINDWDPYQLIEGGTPGNEFESEIAQLLAGLSKCKSVEDVINLTSKIFSESFGSSGFSFEDCNSVGTKIYFWYRDFNSQNT
ncbi:MAG: hypothetical protein WC450_06615 [Candidatus Omnitrophota bacterium]|jgi:hypothetical protein